MFSRRLPLPPLRIAILTTGENERRSDWPYREAVGSLIWVCVISRHDIANTVREVTRYSRNPRRSHWNAVPRILKYLRHTRLRRITYKKGQGLDLKVYTDRYSGGRLTSSSRSSGDCSRGFSLVRKDSTLSDTVDDGI